VFNEMKNRLSLMTIFAATNDQRVLRALVERPNEALYVREVSSLAGVSHGGASEALMHLADLGLATRQERGRLALYTADSAHPVVRYFKVLLNLANLTPLLSSLKPITIELILFGSRAEGSDTPQSDLDLFAIADDKDLVYETIRASDLADHIRPVILSPLESIEMHAQDPLFYDQVMRGILLWKRTGHNEI
jgi:DNA-binding transcriptional ArsR family regulator